MPNRALSLSVLMGAYVSAILSTACAPRGPYRVELGSAYPTTVGRTIPPLSDQVEDKLRKLTATLHEQLHRTTSDAEEDQVQSRARALLSLDAPYIAALLMPDLAWWAECGGGNRPAKVKPLVDFCLRHEDRLIRWSGVFAASKSGASERAYRVLRQDYASLLIRPDLSPWWAVRGWDHFAQRQVARQFPPSHVATMRAEVIRLVGEMELQEAKDVVEAIMRDPREWDSDVVGWAEQAYCRLRGAMGKPQPPPSQGSRESAVPEHGQNVDLPPNHRDDREHGKGG
jgi:hypothetical protein